MAAAGKHRSDIPSSSESAYTAYTPTYAPTHASAVSAPQYGAAQYGAPQFEAPQFGPPQYEPPRFEPPQFRAPQFEAPRIDPPRAWAAAERVGRREPAVPPTGGGRRKRARRRATPAAAGAAGVITLFAATSGAMGLQQDSEPTTMTLHLQDPSPNTTTLSLEKLNEDRAKAAGRSTRSGVQKPVASGDIRQSASAADARERAAWEQQRAAELAGLTRIDSDGDSDLAMKRTIRWVLPLANFRMSAGFGASGSLWSNDHTGQDFSARSGTPVRAIGAGEITFAGWDGSYGNKIVIRHRDGTETWYSHLSGYAERSGTVRPGEVIGYVGSTGNSTGPHLHLEVRPYGGDPIDPLPWLRSLGLEI